MKINRQGASGFFTLHLDIEMNYPKKYWGAFLEELKATIPWRERDYDPKTETWTITDTYYQAVIELRKKHFEKDQMSLF